MKVLTFDVGGTYIKHCIVDNKENITELGRLPTPQSGLEAYLDVLESIISKYNTEICGIAMSVPGALDNQTGWMYTGGSLEYVHGINLAELLSERCGGIPVTVENDAKAAGLAELETGALNDVENGYVCTIGTAFGGCVVVDRKVLRGKNEFAGEFSFIIGEHDNESFRLLRFAGGVGSLFALLAEKTNEDISKINGFTFFKRANAGEIVVLEALHQYCRLIAIHLLNMQTVIDPEKTAIGGGISIEPLLIEVIREEIDKITKCEGTSPRPGLVVVPCRYRNNANLLGAYYNFKNIMNKMEGE